MSADARSDEELMTAYVGGEVAAFDVLFERWAPALAALFRRQVGAGEEGDLVQQTFLQLHRARNDYDPGAPVRPWLFTIALNLGREHLRRRARRPQVSLDSDPRSSGVSDPVATSEEAARMRAALATLPALQREVIELHWFQGLPFAQVAKLVGASESAVKVRAHRGYERLRELLGPKERRPGEGRA